MRCLLVLLLSLIAIAGCGGLQESVTEIQQWTFVPDDGAARDVVLPTHLDLPRHPSRFDLRTKLSIDAGKRGRALTLAFLRLPAIATLYANGHRAVALEADATTWYRVSGAQRWSIPEDLTRGESLELVLHLENRSTQSAWIDTVPRLSASDHGDRAFLAMRFWNEASAYFGFAVVLSAGLGYLLVWTLDRRRRAHGWFVLEAIGGIAFPAFATGLTQPILGHHDTTVMGLQVALAAVAAISFIHAYFDLPYWRGFSGRRLLVAWLLLAGYAAVVSGPFTTTRLFAPLVTVAVGASAWTQIVLCVQLAKRKPRPRNVFLVTLAWPVAGLLGSVEIAWWLGFGSTFRGLQGGSAAIAVVAFLRIAALGREHLRSLRKADRLNEELARRVAALEDKNVEVQRLNEELRRQIAARSAQLADALARVGSRHASVVALDVGHTVAGRYRIVRAIAAGGMGAVYEVERISDKAPFALKVLHGRSDPTSMARFAREAQIAAQIHHSNVVGIVDIDVDADGFLFLVMELVRGESLREWRKREREPRAIRAVLLQIARGLAAIHAQGIIHRDLKPANVLVIDGEIPIAKITDFGISMLAGTPAPYVEDKTAIEVPNARPFALGDATATDLPRSSSLTRTGVVMGTPRYMAPELHDGARFASPSSDVYAFGLVACVALAGAHPNDRPDVAAELRRLAPDLADLVIACLAEDPHERPTLEALVAALDDDRRFTAA